MKKDQRIFLLTGTIVALVSSLYPPWLSTGGAVEFGCILGPPAGAENVHVGALFFIIVILAALATVLIKKVSGGHGLHERVEMFLKTVACAFCVSSVLIGSYFWYQYNRTNEAINAAKTREFNAISVDGEKNR